MVQNTISSYCIRCWRSQNGINRAAVDAVRILDVLKVGNGAGRTGELQFENGDGTYQVGHTSGNVVSFGSSDGNIYAGMTPADLYFFKQTEIVTEMEVIEGDSRPKPGTDAHKASRLVGPVRRSVDGKAAGEQIDQQIERPILAHCHERVNKACMCVTPPICGW